MLRRRAGVIARTPALQAREAMKQVRLQQLFVDELVAHVEDIGDAPRHDPDGTRHERADLRIHLKQLVGERDVADEERHRQA